MSDKTYLPLFCDCGGLIVGKIGTKKGFCVKCNIEYEIRRVS